MITMTLGLLLWSLVHLLPALSTPIKGAAIKTHLLNSLGENGYKGVFSVLIIVSIVLMVQGWQQASVTNLYVSPAFLQTPALILMLCAFICLAASNMPSQIKRLIRHPQLTGVLLWAIAHLLLNGDSRSLLLFGGLGLWALLEILLISRREGGWVKPEASSGKKTALGLLIGCLVFSALVFLHPYLSGIALL